MLLTSNWPELERLPVGFKSKCAGQAYRCTLLTPWPPGHTAEGKVAPVPPRSSSHPSGTHRCAARLPPITHACVHAWGGARQRRHIVLAVRHVPTGQWGALGISRRHDLMYKELGTATSLADLMWIYKVRHT